MSEHTEIVQRASDYVYTLFKEKLPETFVYHTYAHTRQVAETARKIAKEMKLGEEGVEVVTLAGWLQDTGYTEIYMGHEDFSKRIAEKFLRDNQYPDEKIHLILGCIEATKIVVRPRNALEEIVCDAEGSIVGKKSFFDASTLLRIEWEKALGQTFTNEDWDKQERDLLSGHMFFTKYAGREFGDQQIENLRTIDKRIRKSEVRLLPKDEAAIAKIKIEQEKLSRQVEKDLKPDRGIETMFKLLSRNNLAISLQADRKAQTMIHANALIISFLVGFVIHRLDVNPELAIPGFFLLSTCATALIYSVLATRPKVNKGTFTREDIINKQANLLFFGNFYRMEFHDFEWGIKKMMNSKEDLYENIIRDSYLLGKADGRKYQYLRMSYNVFMYGLIISIILFLMAFLWPEFFGSVTGKIFKP